MANALYDLGRNDFLRGLLAWETDDIRVALIDTALYTANLVTDASLANIPPAARVAVGTASLANKTATAGVADADDFTLPGVTGLPVEALVLYKHTGVDATSRLIAYIDSAVGFVLTPNGNAVLIRWSDSANKIFKL